MAEFLLSWASWNMVLIGFLAAVVLVITGFVYLASTVWGPVLIGCGLFLLMKNALR